MNKKHLSVVMAGAMLASSVAPVLAETTVDSAKKYDVSANDLGILKRDLRKFLESKKFHVTDRQYSNESVYYFTKSLKNITNADKMKDVDNSNVIANLKAGDKLYVWSEGFKTDDKGNNFSQIKTENGTAKKGKFTLDLMKADKEWFDNTSNTGGNGDWDKAHKIIENIDVDETNQVLVVLLKNGKSLRFTTEDYTINLSRPTFNGYEIEATEANAQFVDGFVEKTVDVTAGYKDIANELLAEITITPGGYNLSLDDLYDGLFLTEKGQNFLTEIKDNVAIGREVNVHTFKNHFTVSGYIGKDENSVKEIENTMLQDGNIKKLPTGEYVVEVKFAANTTNGLKEEVYSIKSKDLDNLARVSSWFAGGKARVDILAGDNRYETAAKIAEEYAGLTGDKTSTKDKADIVLVNGNALVDGLAASPLAAKLSNGNRKAPVLLTEADHLPKATKAYFQKVLKNVQVGNANKVTIHLVGGEAVLNKSLERELKGLGFSVERYGGANREETSLEVMKAMGSKNEAFVVGANGEADAMSIAAVASSTKTPIVVAANNGISEDATYDLKGKKVTIIGGKTVVSATDEKAIKAEAKGVLRIAGSNRKETNAQIIEKYYKNSFIGEAKNVIVAKDGQRNKMELVDALAAANMASVKNAPIVLATDKISKSQENALELNAKKSFALYQVGHGVAREVVKTIAENLGLSNR